MLVDGDLWGLQCPGIHRLSDFEGNQAAALAHEGSTLRFDNHKVGISQVNPGLAIVI
jgi:hypothetical protein